jgi:hypothetical protein
MNLSSGGQLVDRELTWDGWAESRDDAVLTPVGRATLVWAVDVLRSFFGENWLADNYAETGFVPLLNHRWWPPANARVIVRILELAARIALVTAPGQTGELSAEAKEIYATRDQAENKFNHLCVTLEVAAFTSLAGWSVSYEEPGSSGRRPDLAVRRGPVKYSREVTVMGTDREFRASDRYCDNLRERIRELELRHEVEMCCHAPEILQDGEIAQWLGEAALACRQTALDGNARVIGHGQSHVEIFAPGQRPAGQVFDGPFISGDLWPRVANRIAEKARQTAGDPAWIRIDDVGPLFHLTDRGRQPLQGLLADLHHNVGTVLDDWPHVRGLILSTGALINSGQPEDATAWRDVGQSTLITPGPPRHVLATGPAAMLRALPGGRSRVTLVLPGPDTHLVLPSGVGLEPGLWYHDEPTWLTRALKSLGKPSMSLICR